MIKVEHEDKETGNGGTGNSKVLTLVNSSEYSEQNLCPGT